MEKGRKIALFGGSFNPPHRAHRQVAAYLAGFKDFDAVWMVPAYAHPFTKNLVPFGHRVAMVERMIRGLPKKVLLCTLEGELKNRPSYMIDTLTELQRRHPAFQFTLVVGSDCRAELDQWKEIGRIKQMAAFYFIDRGPESPFMNISSSAVRAKFSRGEDVSAFVDADVLEYMKKTGLYGGP